ncbi:MAG: hypothetical protein DDT37_01733 [Firmicutes bacterium]|nr:hypothetical protein [candidate division NPL-UPA2 bacterium]
MLCTRQQVKDAIGIPGTADDARIDALILEAAHTIMRRYGREFVPWSVATRTFAARKRLVDLAPHDLRSVTSAVLSPGTPDAEILVANTDYTLLPIGGAERTGTFLQLRFSNNLTIRSSFLERFGMAQVQIVGNWGVWADATTVAEDIRRAAIETVLSWLDRPSASVAGLQELGDPHRALAPTAQGWDIPLSAHRKLSAYNTRNLGVY